MSNLEIIKIASSINKHNPTLFYKLINILEGVNYLLTFQFYMKMLVYI